MIAVTNMKGSKSMNPYPYYEKILQEAYKTLWQHWREAHPSLIRSLVGGLGTFLIAFGSWRNLAAHTEIDELDRAEVSQRLNDVKRGHVSV